MPTPQRYRLVLRIAKTSLRRFMAKVRKNPRTKCWKWVGALNGDSYGNFRLSTKDGHITAHRFAYLVFRGPVPSGKELDHVVCSVRRCVNPEHLEPRTHLQNVRRAHGN